MKLHHILSAVLLSVFALTAQAEARKVAIGSARQVSQFHSTALRAQGLSDNQRLLGHILTDSITANGGAFGAAGTYTVGAILTPDVLSGYKGCRVVGLRMAAALNLGRTRTFLCTVNDEKPTVAIEQNQRLYQGWNNVFFNGDGYEIQGDETFFYGFDYTETDEMVAADQGGLCGFGKDTDDGFYAYGNLGKYGVGFYSLSGLGCLCVQLIVDVSSLPDYDLDFISVDIGFRYKRAGTNEELMASISNVGKKDPASYRMGYQIDGLSPVYFDGKTAPPASGSSTTIFFDISIPSDLAIGSHQLALFFSEIDGKPIDEHSERDTIRTSFGIYKDSLARNKAYLEIYTHQASPYVPYLNDVVAKLKKSAYPMVVANVHYPGTPLAIDEAAYLHDLYAYTWPSFTVNRSYFPGEPYIAYDMNDYLPVLPTEMSAGILGDLVLQDQAMPTFASISLDAEYNPASYQLTVTAQGRLLPEAQAIFGELAVTLLITEDSVKNRQAVYNPQTETSSYNNAYLHHDVLRGYLTKPTGDAITPDGDTYKATFTQTLDVAWKPSRLHVIALLTRLADSVTDDNVLYMDVINANSLDLADLPVLGIAAPKAAPTSQGRYYTLDGKPLQAHPQHAGIYLFREPDGSTRKIFIK